MKTSLVIFLLALTLVAAQAEPMPDDFAWFGSLGFTDVKDAPFSRVFWGWTLFSGGKREENWRHGFLLEDTPKKIRVLSLDLQPYELPKERAGKPTEYCMNPATCARMRNPFCARWTRRTIHFEGEA